MSYNSKDKNLFLYPAILIILVGLSYFLFFRQEGPGYYARESFMFLIIPTMVVLAAMSVRSLINKYLAGRLAEALEKGISTMGWGIAVFFFFNLMPQAAPVNLASYWILFLTLSITIWKMLYLIDNYFVIATVIRAIMYLFMGLAARMMVITLWSGGYWDLGIKISTADMVLFGFFVLMLFTLLSLVELSKNDYLKAVGKWCAKSPVSKFIYGCIIIFVFKDLRVILQEAFPNAYILAEWIFLFLVLLVLFLYVRSKLQYAIRHTSNEELKKHVQEIRYDKGSELKDAARYIDDFIYKGEKSKILTFIITHAQHARIPGETLSNIIKPLTDYRDVPVPRVFFRRELGLIDNRNMHNRRATLENVINQIRYYGG